VPSVAPLALEPADLSAKTTPPQSSASRAHSTLAISSVA